MQIALAVVSVLVGVGLLTFSAALVARANAGHQVPYWTNAKRTPARALVLRAAGTLFVLVGAGLLSAGISYWSAAVVAAAFLPGAALLVGHNRRVVRPEPAEGVG